jgi:hypothetical protein
MGNSVFEGRTNGLLTVFGRDARDLNEALSLPGLNDGKGSPFAAAVSPSLSTNCLSFLLGRIIAFFRTLEQDIQGPPPTRASGTGTVGKATLKIGIDFGYCRTH